MNFYEYRIKKGYSQEQLAELCETSWRTIHRIENNNNYKAKFSTMAKLFIYLEIPDKEIISFIKETAKEKNIR